MTEHIFLIGYRGAGKSTIGRLLAAALDCAFVDTDQMVCHKRNMEISQIVAREGWESFRRSEAEAIVEAAAGPVKVVATGGGAVLHQEAWQQIRKRIFVVWLSADIATLAARLSPTGKDGRPSLTGRDNRAEIEEVLAERLPLYSGLADLEVDTGKYGTAEVVGKIVEKYRERCGRSEG
ncbi:shikimate kinase AroL [Desulfopila aestuarii]|uniref:Shikimate kinase n=1 Tax=Desulfopila aestuarii DSM 18488 TaxID=1121416 RepID=A0A1M7Y331_9BACT|nr:shikimate kinase AroL [Desulfopila aestuarii]SHO46169.1 shikimate kinase [Desulfopila aestuarii DSM 18488]